MDRSRPLLLLAAALLPCMAAAEDATPGATFRDCPLCPEMVVVPPGSFTMGHPEPRPDVAHEEWATVDGPPHEVTFEHPFAIGRFPVTVAEYRRFAGDLPVHPYPVTSRCSAVDELGGVPTRALTWYAPGFAQADDHPAVCVSYLDAQAYLRWLNGTTGRRYRLPSEAEWEYVAREGVSDLAAVSKRSGHEHGNYGAADRCCRGAAEGADVWLHTSPVTAFPANAFGVHDVAGNTAELVADCVNEDYAGAPADGRIWSRPERILSSWSETSISTDGQCLGRIVRGRGWPFAATDRWFARRSWWYPDHGAVFMSFRVALDVEPPSERPAPE